MKDKYTGNLKFLFCFQFRVDLPLHSDYHIWHVSVDSDSHVASTKTCGNPEGLL